MHDIFLGVLLLLFLLSCKGHLLDAVMVPPGEKPPPYDFTEVEGGLSGDGLQSSAERGIPSTLNCVSETRCNETQAVTVMDPYHVGPVFIPVGGVSTVVKWNGRADQWSW